VLKNIGRCSFDRKKDIFFSKDENPKLSIYSTYVGKTIIVTKWVPMSPAGDKLQIRENLLVSFVKLLGMSLDENTPLKSSQLDNNVSKYVFVNTVIF